MDRETASDHRMAREECGRGVGDAFWVLHGVEVGARHVGVLGLREPGVKRRPTLPEEPVAADARHRQHRLADRRAVSSTIRPS